MTSSLARIFAAKGRIGKRFYQDLFARVPEIRSLFSEEMRPQQEKFDATLVWVVKEIHHDERLEASLVALAQRHARYGALPHHMPLLGEVLIGALEAEAPGGLSAAEAEAWRLAYGRVSAIMTPALAAELRERVDSS
ncbi:globin domain-containing protein [Palleronia sp. LCG004]|uniref:globin domain-containing protein n=1 Tax=Palleronia sp. LCG004 TaxID=3079304 RepID=UPI0029428DC3|nr:globin domain-containing protein [Palleronia sp. LCG004]WOI58344.1 globin domain-containing protein [Palleronia sp. LCG004]